jgi:hypothetical protein
MGRFGLLEIYTEVDGLETYTRLASVNRHHDQYIDRKYKEAFSPRGNDFYLLGAAHEDSAPRANRASFTLP